MKKKITHKEWEYIGQYNPAAKWLRPFCSYSLTKIDNMFRRECKISWPMYLILFVPAHLLQAFICMWDGGLREFSFEGRDLGYDYFHETFAGYEDPTYDRAKEIWEKA